MDGKHFSLLTARLYTTTMHLIFADLAMVGHGLYMVLVCNSENLRKYVDCLVICQNKCREKGI